jgi:hypothetical protein
MFNWFSDRRTTTSRETRNAYRQVGRETNKKNSKNGIGKNVHNNIILHPRYRVTVRVNIVYLKSIIGPTAEFHITFLIVERKPRDVNLARTFENSRRYENTATVAVHHDVGRVRAVETLVSTRTRNLQEM